MIQLVVRTGAAQDRLRNARRVIVLLGVLFGVATTYALAVAGTRDFGLVTLAVVLQTAGPFAVAALGVSPGCVLRRTGGTDLGSTNVWSS